MRKKHPERNPLFLVDQLQPSISTLLQHLHVSQLRRQPLDQRDIVQGQRPPLDELHGGNGDDHLRAGRDPEHRVRRHGLVGVHAPRAGGVLEDDIAVAVDDGDDQARYAVGPAGDGVDSRF